MTWRGRYTLVAGLALIVLSNAVALIGVAYNRSDTSSALLLTERELTPPFRWRGSKENSGLALSLQWRVLHEQSAGMEQYGWSYPRAGGSPNWLDKAKLESLGFSATQLDSAGKSRESFDNQLSRTALLVLEFNGPAYQESLERARRRAESNATKAAKEVLDREQARNSRLFVIDAGLDSGALYEKYPDRSRYAVVQGQISLRQRDDRFPTQKFLGNVSAMNIGEVNVPFTFRDVFDFAYQGYDVNQQNSSIPFEVKMNFGKRHEPWIVSAFRKK